VTKVMTARVVWNGWLPALHFSTVKAQAEDETEQVDATAMVYLGWVSNRCGGRAGCNRWARVTMPGLGGCRC
jgi:hypothetical protein